MNPPQEHAHQQNESLGWLKAVLPKELPQAPLTTQAIARQSMEEANLWTQTAGAELAKVRMHLLDPSAKGVAGCIPHLERAIGVFQTALSGEPIALADAALNDLRAQLAEASRLFQNAYALQAGWAAAIGLNPDGTPASGLYAPSGEWISPEPAVKEAGSWQG
jgi:hypothetical protein